MRKLIFVALCLIAGAVGFPAHAFAQADASLCVKSVNSIGNYSCVPVNSNNPLPVSTSSSPSTAANVKVTDGTNTAGTTQANSTGSPSAYGLNVAAECYVFDQSGGVVRPCQTAFNINQTVGNNIMAVGPVGQYNTALPTLTTGQVAVLQMDSSSRLIVNSYPQPYPAGASPVTNSATGTTAAIAATLPATSGKTTYICGFSMGGSASAVATGTATVTGTISGTLNFTENIGTTSVPLLPITQNFSPCVPASTTNTTIVVNTIAAGTGGTATVSAWGYQL